MFRVEKRRVGAPGGDLRPAGPLDFENPEHRRGFRFRVEVTDAVSTKRLLVNGAKNLEDDVM